MNSKNHTMEFVDTLLEEVEEKMCKDFVGYESSHGIDVNFKKFAIILRDEHTDEIGVLNAFTAFAEIYIDDMWIYKPFRGMGYGKKIITET
ncbi:MAG: GNAT family N-acetyltransferase [Chlamydiales bacterium]|nr:GNAT family N-acetyltransferase [Chlamydiales bacterium]MBY0530207.1 GNAT family N-acetyltransferase [Rhabdochlamydiaceae bacterium]